MKLPYFRWYPADFDVDENVKLMNLEEIGLFALCLNHAWINGSLPADTEKIRRSMKISKTQFDRAWKSVSHCFEETDGRLTNRRQEVERSLALDKSKKAADAARTRYGRSADAEQTQCGRSADAVPRAQARPGSGSVSESFVEVSSKTTTPEVYLEPDADFFEPELFRDLIGLFLGLGRGVGILDRVKCENAWKGLSQAERRRAHEYAMTNRAEWQTRPTSKISQPWNYLQEKHWEREAQRILQQTRAPTKREESQNEAARRFIMEAKK